MPSKGIDSLATQIKRAVEVAQAPLNERIKKLEDMAGSLREERAHSHAALVAARTVIYQGALRLPCPGKLGLQTILSNMDKAIKGETDDPIRAQHN